MIKFTQQNPGECRKTCIACLVEVSPEKIPSEFHAQESWLKANHFTYSIAPWGEKVLAQDTFYMVGGTAREGARELHCVIYKGSEPYFDPNPKAGFITDEKVVMEIAKKK